MPPTHTTEGLDTAREIRRQFPTTGILVLSAHTEVEHSMELLATGQRIGYLLKSRVTDVDEFIETLERIVKGGSVMDPAEPRAVIDDQAMQRHGLRMASRRPADIPAT